VCLGNEIPVVDWSLVPFFARSDFYKTVYSSEMSNEK
jgi:hypothetical protein